jgi:hypothetical protein
MNAEQIKGHLRYMSRRDKIEIQRWLDAELSGDFHALSGMRRLSAIGQEIEQKRKDAYEKNRNFFDR